MKLVGILNAHRFTLGIFENHPGKIFIIRRDLRVLVIIDIFTAEIFLDQETILDNYYTMYEVYREFIFMRFNDYIIYPIDFTDIREFGCSNNPYIKSVLFNLSDLDIRFEYSFIYNEFMFRNDGEVVISIDALNRVLYIDDDILRNDYYKENCFSDTMIEYLQVIFDEDFKIDSF